MNDTALKLVTTRIQKVMAGEYWVGHEAVTSLVDHLQGLKQSSETKAPQKLAQFTLREREIISAIVTGQAHKDIAAKLSLSEDTVKQHLSNIFTKAGVSNHLELPIWSMDQGFGRSR